MKKLIFIVIVISTNLSIAQPTFDLGSVNYIVTPFPVKNKCEITQLNCFFNLPLKADSNVWIGTPSFDYLTLKTSAGENIKLRNAKIFITRVQYWNEKWKTIFSLHGRTISGVNELFKKNTFQYGVAFLTIRKINEDFKYSFGLYYNKEFFGNYFIPLLGIEWKINQRLSLYGVLPTSLYFNYYISDKFRVGIHYSSITATYRMDLKNYIRQHENEFRLYFNYFIYDKHMIAIEAGHSLLRKFESGITGIKETNTLDKNDLPLIKMGYYYRIPN